MVYDVGSDVTRNALSVAQSSVAPGRPPPQQQSKRSPERESVAGQQQARRPSVPSPVYFEAAPLPHEARIIAVSLSNTMDSFTFDDYLREMYLTVEDFKAMSPEMQGVESGERSFHRMVETQESNSN